MLRLVVGADAFCRLYRWPLEPIRLLLVNARLGAEVS
jgi:hypothetical protein